MRSLAKTSHGGSLAKIEKKQSLSKQLRITFACSMLLGLTWFFGLVAIDDVSEVFQWLFTIFNSLQGFFIFIYYTVLNADVRKEWRGCGLLARKRIMVKPFRHFRKIPQYEMEGIHCNYFLFNQIIKTTLREF